MLALLGGSGYLIYYVAHELELPNDSPFKDLFEKYQASHVVTTNLTIDYVQTFIKAKTIIKFLVITMVSTKTLFERTNVPMFTGIFSENKTLFGRTNAPMFTGIFSKSKTLFEQTNVPMFTWIFSKNKTLFGRTNVPMFTGIFG